MPKLRSAKNSSSKDTLYKLGWQRTWSRSFQRPRSGSASRVVRDKWPRSGEQWFRVLGGNNLTQKRIRFSGARLTLLGRIRVWDLTYTSPREMRQGDDFGQSARRGWRAPVRLRRPVSSFSGTEIKRRRLHNYALRTRCEMTVAWEPAEAARDTLVSQKLSVRRRPRKFWRSRTFLVQRIRRKAIGGLHSQKVNFWMNESFVLTLVVLMKIFGINFSAGLV
jgi:hypothetical protein